MADLSLPLATGVGSLPGVDVREAVRVVLGEWPALPYLPELPARGPGADVIGRTAALLVELPVDLQPAGWRLVARPGREVRRAQSMLDEDLDVLQELAADRTGALKLSVCGPWTLAASLELPRGGPVLGDASAVADLHASLVEGVAQHVAEVRRRLPRLDVVLQLDEPSLPAVLAGGVRTPSGFGRLRAVEDHVAEGVLRRFCGLASEEWVHCCAADPPLALLRRAGMRGLSVDAGLLTSRADDELGEAWEAGLRLVLGVVPGVAGAASAAGAAGGTDGMPSPAASADFVRALARRIGISAERAPSSVVLTPSCGLAGADPDHVRAVAAHLAAAVHMLAQDPEGARG